MASFELRGEPKLLSSPNAAQAAIERGQLNHETLVTVRLPSGQRQTRPARDVPQFAKILPLELPQAVHDDAVIITGGNELDHVVPTPYAERATVTATIGSAIPAVSADGGEPSEKELRELIIGGTGDQDSIAKLANKDTASFSSHNGAGIPVAKVVSGILAGVFVLVVLVGLLGGGETATDDKSAVTASADGQTAKTDSAISSKSTPTDAALDANATPVPTALPDKENTDDSCAELRGFELVMCQSPGLKSADRQLRATWSRAQRRMADADQDVEPLAQILGRIKSCKNKSCAQSAYAVEISSLENTTPRDIAPVAVAEAARCTPAAPKPKGNPGSWVTDYPSRALREEREGTTSFVLEVDPSGRVASCTITASSGSADLDEATCKSVRRRARFSPGIDAQCKPVGGKYSNRVQWRIPDGR